MLVSNLDRAVVIAHYDEDPSWLKNISIPYILYTRTLKNQGNLIPNKGREALCYFLFIVDYYDNLPNEIGFFHGHRTSYHQDFDSDLLINQYRWGTFDYVNVCRGDLYGTIGPNTPYVREYGWVKDFWKLFATPYLGELPESLGYCLSAQFFVKKHRILRLPREFYFQCLKFLSETTLECSASARIFEYIWHIIMGERNPEERKMYTQYLNGPLPAPESYKPPSEASVPAAENPAEAAQQYAQLLL